MRRFTPLALGWAIVLGGIALFSTIESTIEWASAQHIVEAAPPIPGDEGEQDVCGAHCFVLAAAEAEDEGEPTQPTGRRLLRRGRHPGSRRAAQFCQDASLLPADFLTRTAEYLPPAETASGDAAADAERLQADIRAVQQPSNCSLGGVLMPVLKEYGMGATLHGLVKPLLHSLKTQTALLSPAFSMYADRRRCAAADFTCYFRALSRCDRAPISVPGATSTIHARHVAKVPDAARHVNAFMYTEVTRNGDRALPAAYRHRGLFWVVAQLLRYLLRPAPPLLAHIRRRQRELRWPRDAPVLGVHVRKGDSCAPGEGERTVRVCDGLDAYMPAIRRIGKAYGIRHVFLATDDGDTLRAARRHTDFTWLYLKDASASSALRQRARVEHLIAAGKLNGYDEGLGALLDMELLARCDAFVGKFTSNMDRLVFALMSGRRGGCVPPYASIDSRWCFDFGVRSGRTLGNESFKC